MSQKDYGDRYVRHADAGEQHPTDEEIAAAYRQGKHEGRAAYRRVMTDSGAGLREALERLTDAVDAIAAGQGSLVAEDRGLPGLVFASSPATRNLLRVLEKEARAAPAQESASPETDPQPAAAATVDVERVMNLLNAMLLPHADTNPMEEGWNKALLEAMNAISDYAATGSEDGDPRD